MWGCGVKLQPASAVVVGAGAPGVAGVGAGGEVSLAGVAGERWRRGSGGAGPGEVSSCSGAGRAGG